MKVLEFLDQISFKKLTGLSVVLALLLTIPLNVWLVQQETKTTSEASFENPKLTRPEKKYGKPSGDPPQISLVWPFVGKVDDALLIYGQNFGDNPQDKILKMGQVTVNEEKINCWTPKLIEFQIPKLPPGGLSEPVSLTVAGQTTTWDYPFTVYDFETKTQIAKPNQSLILNHGPSGSKIEIFFDNGEKTEGLVLGQINLPEGKTIISLRVVDQNDQSLPFFVEPSEFGF